MGTALLSFTPLGVPVNDAENTTDLYGTPYHVMTTRKTATSAGEEPGYEATPK